jgi:protein-L-isoaspartate(D-aspartate) O-methyltransferase
MDYELARHNMIEQQIRPWEVLDQRVLDLLGKVKREDFVPPQYRSLAFVDMEIPLGHGECMWSPKLEARVLQALAIQRQDKVLEVGTGSGYFTALLASQAMQVISVEIEPEFRADAEAKLRAHGFANVTCKAGDAARDWAEDGQFDVIVLTGSCPAFPEAFRQRLKSGGRLFVIEGEAPAMTARLVTRTGLDSFRADSLFETALKALRNAPQPELFEF